MCSLISSTFPAETKKPFFPLEIYDSVVGVRVAIIALPIAIASTSVEQPIASFTPPLYFYQRKNNDLGF